MLQKLKNAADTLITVPKRTFRLFRLSFIIPAVAAFLLTLTVCWFGLERQAAAVLTGEKILQMQKALNEINLDIAYDKLKISASVFSPLLEAENFQIYTLRSPHPWKLSIKNLRMQPGWFNYGKLTFDFGQAAEWTFDGQIKNLSFQTAEGKFLFKKNRLEQILAVFADTEVKDFAKIKEINLAARRISRPQFPQALIPFFENHLEIKNVSVNGLINYPLTSQIDRLYLKTNLMGEFPEDDSFRIALEEWLHHGGFVEIGGLAVNWPPLSLVGHGELTFNEEFTPAVHLQTSSKALAKLLEDLQNNQTLNKKGVFVAQILLNNKSFKLHPNDKYLTVLTPIDYRDGRLSVENITVKNFNLDTAQ